MLYQKRGVVMTFSEFVIFVRKKLNLSQTQLANAINVSYSTINRWENCHVMPSNLAVKSFFDFCENNFIDIPDGLFYYKTTCHLSLKILGGKKLWQEQICYVS